LVIDKTLVAALIGKAIDGDQTALRAIYDCYADTMFNISLRMTANRADAEDIVQESFIDALGNLRKLRDATTFGGWLRQIVINNCLKHAKGKKIFEALPDSLEPVDEGEGDSWLTQNNFRKIQEAIKNLPEGCRQIFLLYTMEDLKHREIGERLSISESTSKSQYLRAKKLLQDYLKKEQWIK
jgi:RNA polymerase sigma-70 factor (ECF subfamily)